MTDPASRDQPLESASDGELARRIQARGGGPAEEAELCRRLLPRVQMYGLRHLRDRDTAADLAQHVMLLALERLRAGTVERPERITSFVLGTARLAARDFGRADQRWRAQTGGMVSGQPQVDAPELLDTERLRLCLGELAERERAVVVLTFFDRLPGPEIGSRLGLSGGNVRVIRLRALNRLRACVDGSAGEEGA